MSSVQCFMCDVYDAECCWKSVLWVDKTNFYPCGTTKLILSTAIRLLSYSTVLYYSKTVVLQWDWWLPSLEAADRTAGPWCSGPAEDQGWPAVQVGAAGSWPPRPPGRASWWWAETAAPGGSPSGCLTREKECLYMHSNNPITGNNQLTTTWKKTWTTWLNSGVSR